MDKFVVNIAFQPKYSLNSRYDAPVLPLFAKTPTPALLRAHIEKFTIKKVLSPVWSTQWISESGKAKLEKYGIAPPNPGANGPKSCPQCKSTRVSEISAFGSTPCQALWRCQVCLEPFNYFKCL